MGSVKGTEGDAEASGNQSMGGGVIPTPKAEETREDIVQLELWRRSDLERAKTEFWSKRREKTAQPFLLPLICLFFPVAKPSWKPETKGTRQSLWYRPGSKTQGGTKDGCSDGKDSS